MIRHLFTFFRAHSRKALLLLVLVTIFTHYFLFPSVKTTTPVLEIESTTQVRMTGLQGSADGSVVLPECPEIPPDIPCSNGNYGVHCNISCGRCTDSINTCDRHTGACVLCLPGWTGERCDIENPLMTNSIIPEWSLPEFENPLVTVGGRYKPRDCVSRSRVAIVIPCRNRESHLKVLLRYLHPFLQRQQLDYGIFVVEQSGNSSFNKAFLLNVGFTEALKLYDFQCCIFHDVDLLPEDARNLYTCPQMPRHMSVAVDTIQYKLFYSGLIGGVLAMPVEHFRLVNGYSNLYFKWGGEDDDMYKRIINRNLTIERYPERIARYKMFKHSRKAEDINPNRFELLDRAVERQKSDGLTSLKYNLIKLEQKPLFTWILVDLVTTTNTTTDDPGHSTTTPVNTNSTATNITKVFTSANTTKGFKSFLTKKDGT